MTPAMLAAARSPESHAQPAPALAHKHGHMRASVLLAEFFKAKSPGWGEATKIQMTGMCGVFVELMGDPTLSEIDGVKMHRYREQLLTLPRDLYQTRRRLKTATLADLVAAAGQPCVISPQNSRR